MVMGLAVSLSQGTTASLSVLPILFWERVRSLLSSRQRQQKSAVTPHPVALGKADYAFTKQAV